MYKLILYWKDRRTNLSVNFGFMKKILKYVHGLMFSHLLILMPFLLHTLLSIAFKVILFECLTRFCHLP